MKRRTNCFDMREILNQANLNEMILQSKVVLSFYHDWSKYSAVDGIQYFKEADNFFRNEKGDTEIIFWLADVSNENSPAAFLCDWIKNNSVESNLFGWINAGNPSIIWLNFGQNLSCEFSSYILKRDGIIEKTNKYFDL